MQSTQLALFLKFECAHKSLGIVYRYGFWVHFLLGLVRPRVLQYSQLLGAADAAGLQPTLGVNAIFHSESFHCS